MFLGDANRTASRLRGESLKSQITFWWRVLNFARAAGQNRNNLDAALRDLQLREKRIFGGPGEEGQSSVLISFPSGVFPAKQSAPPKKLNDAEGRTVGPGACYFGYGLMKAFGKDAGELERSCFLGGQVFQARFLFSHRLGDEDISSFIEALKFFGLVGGLRATLCNILISKSEYWRFREPLTISGKWLAFFATAHFIIMVFIALSTP